MKRLIYLVCAVTLLSMILSACTGAAVGATQPPAGTDPLAATDAPTAVPIDLVGPLMEVGNFYTYFDGSILAPVPAGPFLMGYFNFFDTIEHTVTLSDYWIYTNEVTNEQYASCVKAGKCTPPDKQDNPDFDNYRLVSHPVVGVNYQQAAEYCGFAHGRLPTEAEWEKAARGPEGNIFPWGDAAPVCDLLNFDYCKSNPVDVKSYPNGVSFYGLFDMSGNVKEWAADWYKPDYDLQALIDPLGAALGQKRSVRSSSFSDSADFTYVAHRFSLLPINHLADLGFRCVVDDPTAFGLFCQSNILYGADVNGNPTDDVIPLPDNCEQAKLIPKPDCTVTTDTSITASPWPLPAGAYLTIPDPPQCVNGPSTWDCNGTGTATIKAQTCDLPPPPDGGSCAPGYQESPDPSDETKKICTGQGPGVECPDGFQFDALLHCCSAINPGPNQYGLCPAGFYQVGEACIPSGNGDNNPGPVDVSVSWAPVNLCPGKDTTGGDDEQSCPNTCSAGNKQCSDCSCVYQYAPCP